MIDRSKIFERIKKKTHIHNTLLSNWLALNAIVIGVGFDQFSWFDDS